LPVPYLLFYLLSGYAAAYGYAAANPGATQPLIGASGVIADLIVRASSPGTARPRSP
jgi:membrane associated rhomboid family serine protease